MYNLTNKSGLLYADISLSHNGKVILVPDVIIDTGACQSIILTEYLFDLGIGFQDEDEIVVLSGIGGAEASAWGTLSRDILETDTVSIETNTTATGLTEIQVEELKK